MKLPQFPPKPLPPLFPEIDIQIPAALALKSLTIGILPQVSVTFDIQSREGN